MWSGDNSSLSSKRERNKMAVTTKKARKLSEDTLITIINNTRGRLGYVNRQLQEWIFGETGDELEISIRDLREMKSSHIAFFKEQWIVFAEEDRDAIDFLKVDKYYQDLITPDFIEAKLNGDESEFIKFLKDSNANIRAMILSMARDKFTKGEMKNAYIVRAIEDTLSIDIDIENPRK
jgi:hypothetical protein